MAAQRFTVPPGSPPRLDASLAKWLPGIPKAKLQKLLAEGKVKVNGKVAKPLRRVFGGEEVVVEVEDVRPSLQPTPAGGRGGVQLSVLFEDAEILVINKPTGLVVESSGERDSVAAMTGAFVAHRLDKDTTGCLVLAKTNAALASLQRAFEEKRIKKTYLALVLGAPEATGKLDTPYGRNPEDPRRYTSRVSSARRARLSWVKREQFDEVALLEIDLDTGRTHQIRAQLSDIGHPLLADWLYGNAEAKTLGEAIGRIPLHAWKLRIDEREFEAPLPSDIEAALSALRAKARSS